MLTPVLRIAPKADRGHVDKEGRQVGGGGGYTRRRERGSEGEGIMA